MDNEKILETERIHRKYVAPLYLILEIQLTDKKWHNKKHHQIAKHALKIINHI